MIRVEELTNTYSLDINVKTEGLLIRLAPRKLRVLLFTYKPAWTFFINGDELAIAFVLILIRPTGNILP